LLWESNGFDFLNFYRNYPHGRSQRASLQSFGAIKEETQRGSIVETIWNGNAFCHNQRAPLQSFKEMKIEKEGAHNKKKGVHIQNSNSAMLFTTTITK
jgi:hypothetical protein